jgi:hypothetical protein
MQWPLMIAPSGTIGRQVDLESSAVTLLMEVMMKRCIVPRQFVLPGQFFEPGDEVFRQIRTRVLRGGVTEIDSTSEWTRSARHATILGVLPGASLPVIQGTLRLGRMAEQELNLKGRNVERVPVFLKPTTPAAQLTDCTETRHLVVELVVQSAKVGL